MDLFMLPGKLKNFKFDFAAWLLEPKVNYDELNCKKFTSNLLVEF